MAGAANFSNLTLSNFTGINFNQIMQSVLAQAQIPESQMQGQIAADQTSISAVGQIGSDLSSLQVALGALNTDATNPPLSVQTSAGAPFSAQVSGTPLAGIYSVAVNQLATPQITASQGYASDSSVLGTGAIGITIGGITTNISITNSNDTLDGVAQAINSAGIGVTAQIVNTGLPGSPYRLEITGNSTGSAQGFTISPSLSGGTSPIFNATSLGSAATSITGSSTPTFGGAYTGDFSQGYYFTVASGGTLGSSAIAINWKSDSGESGTINVPSAYIAGTPITVADGMTLSLGSGTLNIGDQFSVAAFNPTLQNAQNASVLVGSQAVSSPTNTVTNAISGVTLNLSGTGGPYSVTVSQDNSSLANDINSFVSAYNTAMSDIQKNTQAVPNQQVPPLAANGALESVYFGLQSGIGAANLSDLGISVDSKTGVMSFSASGLASELSTNPTAVTSALTSLYNALNPQLAAALDHTTGAITVVTNSYSSQIADLNQQISQMQAQITQEQNQLQAEYAQIQAQVFNEQSLATYLSASSGSGSSSSGGGTPAPGSNLTLSA